MKNISEIGDEFEREVGEYFRPRADYVDINRRIRGRSGLVHEIDIYVVKKGVLGSESAVECKYKNNGCKVTQEEVANFIVKLSDTGIRRGEFVTNSTFTNAAKLIGVYYGLILIEEFKERTRKNRYG
jgi:hypothetical protein